MIEQTKHDKTVIIVNDKEYNADEYVNNFKKNYDKKITVKFRNKNETYNVVEEVVNVKDKGQSKLVIAKKNPTDKRAEYYISDDINLSAEDIITTYKKRKITLKEIIIITLSLVIPFVVVRELLEFFHLDANVDVIGTIIAVTIGLWYILKEYEPLKEIFDDRLDFRENFGILTSVLIGFSASFSSLYIILGSIEAVAEYSYFAALIAGYITVVYYTWLKSCEIYKFHLGKFDTIIEFKRIIFQILENNIKALCEIIERCEVIKNLQKDVRNKADQNTIDALQKDVDNKADQKDVDNKADQKTVDVLTDGIKNIFSTLKMLTYLRKAEESRITKLERILME